MALSSSLFAYRGKASAPRTETSSWPRLAFIGLDHLLSSGI